MYYKEKISLKIDSAEPHISFTQNRFFSMVGIPTNSNTSHINFKDLLKTDIYIYISRAIVSDFNISILTHSNALIISNTDYNIP